MTRYTRQSQLPEVGPAGQDRLRAARALLIGAGGLGVPALQYLTGAGVGAITLVDPDRVETGNLHRQPIYGRHIGAFKAEAAAAEMAALNPDCAVTPITARLDPANARALVTAADIVLDCADSFAASYTLSDTCLATGTPLISASALGLSGYAGGFCGGAPSLRALFPDLPDRAATCASAGVLGPTVGLIGCLQAQMALRHLLGLAPSPLGQLTTLTDGFRFGGFRFDGAPEPTGPQPRFIATSDIRADDFLIDLRDTTEAPRPVAPQAIRATVDGFGPDGPRPAHGQRAVLACRSGLRAWHAATRLRAVWDGDITLIAAEGTAP